MIVPDVIGPNLKILFCGINPGLYSAKVGHHFARPGNRFWKVLFYSGFTPYELNPQEDQKLLGYSLGITNLVARTTARASEISDQEFVEGSKVLIEKLQKYQPKYLAVLGIEAYQKAFSKPNVKVGLQEKSIVGIKVWVLPNPSGLNAYYNIEKLVNLFKELKKAIL